MVSLTETTRDLIRRWRPVDLKERVIQAALNGTKLSLSDDRPTTATLADRIPGELIYDVLSGKFGPLHHRGLQLRGFYIVGDIDLSFLEWKGQLALRHCHIEGDVILVRSHPIGEIDLEGTRVGWVNMRSATIDGNMIMRDGFRSERGVYGNGVRITGALHLHHSTVIGPEDETSRMAIELFRSTIGDLFLAASTVSGGMYASGMTVERNVRLQGTAFTSRKSLGWQHTGADYKGALSLANCEIKGTIYIRTRYLPQFAADGGVTLRGASCKQIFIIKSVFDQFPFDVEGFTYSRLRGISARELLDVIEKSPTFASQAYVQLASYCSSIGELSTRRRTLISLEKKLTRQLPLISAIRLTRSLHGALVAHGYAASRAILWLACLVVAATVLLHCGGELFARKPAGGQLPGHAEVLGWSDSLRIVIDSFLPFASLGMKDAWVAVPSALGQWAWMAGFLLLRFAAWGLAALALLSFTNVVRNLKS